MRSKSRIGIWCLRNGIRHTIRDMIDIFRYFYYTTIEGSRQRFKYSRFSYPVFSGKYNWSPARICLLFVSSMVTYPSLDFNYKIAEGAASKGCAEFYEDIYLVGSSVSLYAFLRIELYL